MPAQKRSLVSAAAADPSPTTSAKEEEEEEQEQEVEEDGGEEEGEEKKQQEHPELPKQEDDSEEDEEGGSEAEKDEFILVKLADIRKEVQCPICLGIIRKTRTVMECLHRFCRECIDKSMRLGNNECPACRTHCASRRSLRDDPNYDALIAALYPDIDKYEEEELAFHEEEQSRNKKIQASIAETFRRQSEALGRKRSAARTRRSQYRSSHNSYLRGRGRSSSCDASFVVSEDEVDEEANVDGKESSSADDPSPNRRPKRRKRWVTPRSSPARTALAGFTDIGGGENDGAETRDGRGTPSLQVGNREMLAWGKGGVRSQIRHGNSNGANGRFMKGGRITKLVEYIRNLEETDNEFDVHLTLLPMEEQSVPNLPRPYICCRPSLSIGYLCQFIASQINVKDEAVELFVRKPHSGCLELKPSASAVKADSEPGPSNDLQLLKAHESLAVLRDFFTNARGDLILVYHLKKRS